MKDCAPPPAKTFDVKTAKAHCACGADKTVNAELSTAEITQLMSKPERQCGAEKQRRLELFRPAKVAKKIRPAARANQT
jgi:hypothetical protein